MDFQFTEDQQKFRREVREFLEKERRSWWDGGYWAYEAEQEDDFREFWRKLGERRWLAISWPTKYGGLGRSVIEQLIYNEELGYSLAPQISNGGVSRFAGEALIHHGSEEQKRRFLPLMASGKIIVCQALTEPEAGSDAASLQTKAIEDENNFVINGHKTLIGAAHLSSHIWLAARTEDVGDKHKGISLFLFDINTPGVTVIPRTVVSGVNWVCDIYFDDVKIPKESLLGVKNEGWYQLVTALNFERITFGSGATVIGCAERVLSELVRWTKEKTIAGESLACNPLVRSKLAQMACKIEVGRMLCYRAVFMQATGSIPISEASIAKVFCSELNQQLANTGMQILGLYSQLEKNSKWAQINGMIQYMYLSSIADTIGAGTSEIQRNIIAIRALGMPKR